MRNIILIPAAVLGCAVLGAIAGGVNFGILLVVNDWLVGHVPATDAQWAALGARASIPAFAFGIPVGAMTGMVVCDDILRDADDVPTFAGIFLGVALLLACIIFPLYQSFFAALKTLSGGTKVMFVLSLVSVGWMCDFPTKLQGWFHANKAGKSKNSA